MRWEAVALTHAAKAGIPVPGWRIETVGDKPVLLLRRFDRERGTRIPFVSGMSMLDARDNQVRSYLEFLDILRQHGAAPKEHMRDLWRRIVFSVLTRVLTTAIDLNDGTASLKLALDVAGYFARRKRSGTNRRRGGEGGRHLAEDRTRFGLTPAGNRPYGVGLRTRRSESSTASTEVGQNDQEMTGTRGPWPASLSRTRVAAARHEGFRYGWS